jgi:hypothetical protein
MLILILFKINDFITKYLIIHIIYLVTIRIMDVLFHNYIYGIINLI